MGVCIHACINVNVTDMHSSGSRNRFPEDLLSQGCLEPKEIQIPELAAVTILK